MSEPNVIGLMFSPSHYSSPWSNERSDISLTGVQAIATIATAILLGITVNPVVGIVAFYVSSAIFKSMNGGCCASSGRSNYSPVHVNVRIGDEPRGSRWGGFNFFGWGRGPRVVERGQGRNSGSPARGNENRVIRDERGSRSRDADGDRSGGGGSSARENPIGGRGNDGDRTRTEGVTVWSSHGGRSGGGGPSARENPTRRR